MKLRALLAVCLSVLLGATASCSAPSAASSPQVSVEDAWVRTTDDTTMPTMTAAFMTLVNPSDHPITLVSATSDAAGMTQLHEMVQGADGKMLMQEAKAGVAVPAGSHAHLTPGGYHVMLMDLKHPLPVGDEVRFVLTFDTGQTVDVLAPVKVFTEEEDHYHTADGGTVMKTPSATPTRS